MKNLLTGIIFLLSIFCLNAQNIELRLSTDLGINANTFQTNTDWNNVENRGISFGAQLEGIYHFRKAKKLRPFVGTGIGFEDRAFHYDIKSNHFGYTVESVKLNQNFISIPLIAGIEYNVFKNNSIGLQYSIGYNMATSKTRNITSPEDTKAILGSLDFEYLFRIQSDNHLSESLSLYSKMQINKNLFFMFSVAYVNNKAFGTYDHFNDQVQTLTDLNTSEEMELHSSFQSQNQTIEGNFLKFKIGVSQWF